MTDEPYRLHSSLGYQMSLTARILERHFEDQLRDLGLSRITWCVLLAAGVEDLSQPSEISGFVGIDRTATSRALRQMERDGLIARDPGETDKRTTRVLLTKKGCALLDKGTGFARKNATLFDAKLASGDAETLKALLAKLRQNENTNLTQL